MNKEAFRAFVEASGLSDKDKDLVKGVMYDYLGSVTADAMQNKVPSKEEIIAEAKMFRINEQDEGAYHGFRAGAEWMEQQLEPLITELGMDKARKAPQSVEVMTLNAKEFIYSKQYCEDSYFDFNEQVLPFMEEYALQFKLQAEEATRIAFETITEIATQRDSLKAELEQVKAERDAMREALQEIVELPDLIFGDDYKTDGYALALEDVHRIANKALQSTKK